METNTKTKNHTVWLDVPEDWHIWILLVQLTVESDKADVWPMIDPSKPEDKLVPMPVEPLPPLLSDINPAATSVIQIKAGELQQWNTGYQEYTHLLKRYKKIRSTLNTVKTYIISTVTRRNIGYIIGKASVYAMLVSLQSALAASTKMHQAKIVKEYRALQVWNERESIETWIGKWETTYRDACAIDLPEVSGERPLEDFLTAISQYSPSYSQAAIAILQRDLSKDNAPTMETLIREFRHALPMLAAQDTSTYSHSAFSTDNKGNSFKDSPANKSLEGQGQGQNRKGKKDCLCGRQHYFGQCYYYNPEVRLSG